MNNMDYKFIEINMDNINDYCDNLYNRIKKDKFDYDLVIFIARGSYIIGNYLSCRNNVPLIEIFASRSGGKLKKILSPFLKIVPKNVKKLMRKMEVNSGLHDKKSERKITYNNDIWKKYKDSKKILLVDDSVDTGYSILASLDAIKKYFVNAEIKVAVLNYFEKSLSLVNTDYSVFIDCMLKGPWSSDSNENNKYMKLYNEWHEKEGK